MCSYCFDHETTLLTRDEIKKMLPLLITPENINMPNNDGNTPFHLACMHGYQYIIEALMGSPITRPNLHLKNRVGLTPINCLPIHETMLNIRNFIIRNTYSRRPVGS